jgi:DNA-binding CsgD family transcriptional regulator
MALVERAEELTKIDGVVGAGGVVVVEGGAGIGKTALIEAACQHAAGMGQTVLRARGSELEAEFAFGVVRQLFERKLLAASGMERDEWLAGPAGGARFLVGGQFGAPMASDASFAVLHGLYWLAANLCAGGPLVIAVDDAQCADGPSRRWLAYLAARLQGLRLTLLLSLRPAEPSSRDPVLMAVREQANQILRPQLLSEHGVATVVHGRLGPDVSQELCRVFKQTSGGNPFYLSELLRGVELGGWCPGHADPQEVVAMGASGVAGYVSARLGRLDPMALRLAQALAVLGDGCELRQAADLVDLDLDAEAALTLAASLVRVDVLASIEPLLFLHPIVREALEASLESDRRVAAHRRAARLLDDDGAPPGRVAAHLMLVHAFGDGWVVARLREAARAAMASGAPQAAAELLRRAVSEPPAIEERVDVLRELARAEITAGWDAAAASLGQAMGLASDRRQRAEIAVELAEVYKGLFRWVDAVDLIERALDELDGADDDLATRLEGELVVAGLHDARRAALVAPVVKRLQRRQPEGVPAEALAVSLGMAAGLAGRPAQETASSLEAVLQSATGPVEDWDTRAALLWSLITVEAFETVEGALENMIKQVHRSGSNRGFVATYSSLGLLKLRLGALPEAETAAGVALRVMQEGDFAPGLAFAATVLADIAVEAGNLDGAEQLIGLLPPDGWSPGVGTVLIPAARGRLRLAQQRWTEALSDFGKCASMFSAELWGMEMRDVGYLHARAGASQALLGLDQRDRSRKLAFAELADVRVFGGPRALGVAARAAGTACGGGEGLELLRESVGALERSPARLERAKSLLELGAALRRSGQRTAAQDPLAEALDLAARCGASPVAARAGEELKAAGARPRRRWLHGAEALTPTELRVAQLAAEGKTNREIAHTLYVTLKTVEGHLARVYAKLGISGRGGLAAGLAGEKSRVGTL